MSYSMEQTRKKVLERAIAAKIINVRSKENALKGNIVTCYCNPYRIHIHCATYITLNFGFPINNLQLPSVSMCGK